MSELMGNNVSCLNADCLQAAIHQVCTLRGDHVSRLVHCSCVKTYHVDILLTCEHVPKLHTDFTKFSLSVFAVRRAFVDTTGYYSFLFFLSLRDLSPVTNL